MYKISGQIIENTVHNWRVEVTAGEKSLIEMKTRREIF